MVSKSNKQMKKLLLLTTLLLCGVTLTVNAQSFNNPKGYMKLIELGGGLGTGDWGADRISVSMVNGYRIMPQFAIGVGVGFEITSLNIDDYYVFFGDSKRTDYSIPVYLHLRSDFLNGKISPFVACNLGYNIFIRGNDNKAQTSADQLVDFPSYGGVMLEPMAGVGFNVGENRMSVGVSFLMNTVKYATSIDSYTKMALSYNLKIGYSF